MPREKEIPAGVIAGEGFEKSELSNATEDEKQSQSFTLIQLTPRERPRGWKKIYGRIAVGESDGEVFVNPVILGPWAGISAFNDGVAVIIFNEPLFVPISWAIRQYPQHAEDLSKLVSHVERALREEEGAK